MRPRIFAIAWAVVCVSIAMNTAAQMFVTFVPSRGRTGDVAAAELAGIERVRNLWATDVWITSAFLTVNAIVIVIVFWKRRPAA